MNLALDNVHEAAFLLIDLDFTKHHMATTSDAAKHMGQLIDDLLAFSRMGRNEIIKTAIDLDALVEEVIRELAPEIHGRIIHWHIADLPTFTLVVTSPCCGWC